MQGSSTTEREQEFYAQDSNLTQVKGRSGLITLSPRKVAEMSPERTAEILRKEGEINQLRGEFAKRREEVGYHAHTAERMNDHTMNSGVSDIRDLHSDMEPENETIQTQMHQQPMIPQHQLQSEDFAQYTLHEEMGPVNLDVKQHLLTESTPKNSARQQELNNSQS